MIVQDGEEVVREASAIPFMSKINNLNYEAGGIMQPRCSFLICATPHNGSTLLCEALRNTGLAGWPEEYFEDLRHTSIAEQLAEYSQFVHEPTFPIQPGVDNFIEYLARVLIVGTSPNGVFGAKILWSYFDDFLCGLRQIPSYKEMPVRELLPTVFPNLHYIWITRRNKVQQAISFWQAFQRRTWHFNGSSPRDLVFNFEVIDHLLQQIMADELDWLRYFDVCGIEPFTVVYEDLVDAYEDTIRNVLEHLQIAVPHDMVLDRWPIERPTDAISEQWATRYHHIKGEQLEGVQAARGLMSA